MDPATAMLISSAIASSAKVGGEALSALKGKKAGKLRAKETKRSTKSSLLREALQRSAELEAHRLKGKSQLGKRKAQSYQDTADLVRGALNI